MSSDEYPIPPSEYRVIAEHVPVVSADLLVHHNGGLMLGQRQNEPAKGLCFVPGGSVLKSEDRRQAVHRVAREELGTDVTIERELGVYDHFYDAAESEGVDSKQYLATTYVVTPVGGEFDTDSQHAELRTFTAPFPDLHDYIWRYVKHLQAAGYRYR